MRTIHSSTALKYFEAAARQLSFKQAATELCVTPTAVSHQIRKLERELGCALFQRKVRQVVLTDQGRFLFNTLSTSFDAIDLTIDQLRHRPGRDVVILGLGSIIGTHWLAPRLGDFWRSHPEIDLRLHHSASPWHQIADHLDLAIAWGDGDWTGVACTPFLDIALTPVLSSNLEQPVEPADLLDCTLIHQGSRDHWQQWFQQAGEESIVGDSGMLIDDANLALQAAVDGQGVALGVLPFVQAEINDGRLRRPFDLSINPDQAYYLLMHQGTPAKPAAVAVKDWLISQLP